MRNETVEVKLKKAIFQAFVCGMMFAAGLRMVKDDQIDMACIAFVLCFITGAIAFLKAHQIHVEYTDMQLLNKHARFPLKKKESKDV